jgi:ankyrin repeat protein
MYFRLKILLKLSSWLPGFSGSLWIALYGDCTEEKIVHQFAFFCLLNGRPRYFSLGHQLNINVERASKLPLFLYTVVFTSISNNCMIRYGNTALHNACEEERLDVAKLLLHAGASLEVLINQGLTISTRGVHRKSCRKIQNFLIFFIRRDIVYLTCWKVGCLRKWLFKIPWNAEFYAEVTLLPRNSVLFRVRNSEYEIP